MDIFTLIFKFIIPIILLIVAYFTGNYYEKKHYASILAREEALSHITILSIKRPPADFTHQQLVKGSVVISSDYFRRFWAWLVNLVGGNIRIYDPLLDRARREAILCMKEEAEQIGANVIFNFRFETSSLNNVNIPQEAVANDIIEVLAYGTAGKIPLSHITPINQI